MFNNQSCTIFIFQVPDLTLITVPALTQHSNSMNQLNKLSVSNQLESSAHGKPSLNSLHQPLVIPPQAE